MNFPFSLMIVVHSKSRNRNYRAHKLNKERVTITFGTMILIKGTPNTKDLTWDPIFGQFGSENLQNIHQIYIEIIILQFSY